jgi:hypothetical protein
MRNKELRSYEKKAETEQRRSKSYLRCSSKKVRKSRLLHLMYLTPPAHNRAEPG